MKKFINELQRFDILQFTLRNRYKLFKTVEEVNDDYDPRFACNGGSYYQPYFTEYYEKGFSYNVDDTSCGEFGDRYRVFIKLNNKIIAYYSIDEVSRPYMEQVAVNFKGVTDKDIISHWH